MVMICAESRDRYFYWLDIQTRWQDGDPYGHVNNVLYYSYFDTALTKMLIDHLILRGPYWNAMGLCVESQCRFHDSITYPEMVETGVRIGHIGNTSLRYELALFKAGAPKPCATGHFVHVFVDPQTRRPISLVEPVREAMKRLMLPADTTTF